ncbi:hypothetical protein GCM10028805_06190 [Spirosoma harenae]
MFVLISSITTQGEVKYFSFRVPTLEIVFNVLSQIRKTGDSLLSIQVIDGNQVLFLPAEAFDGQDFSQPLSELEQQWKRLLEINSGNVGEQ